ncbi:efflux RND transporter permease subunit [Leucobacter sp. M11]|uniref:efflux RND transporter permease subunit n=1 Tax=Leucobacter sp. M11 TaxID=2993565 RepID=UPI002D7F022E|nr:efflux RND transporter permease subunit [Leucobacter sp. M11]MEB4616292.1 efflux RND transporter permease subunit [Leucobacter sp. M11]
MTALTRVSLKNRLVVALLTLAVAVFGFFATGSLRQELMPSMTQPTAFIQVTSPGIAADQMVETVTEPVEQALTAVPALEQVTSYTSAGEAQILVDWPFDEDQDEVMRSIRGAVDAVVAGMPAGTKADAAPWGTEGMPAMQLSAGSSGDQAEFVAALESRVLPALRAVDGVQKAELAGQAAQRVEITVRAEDAKTLGVEAAQIPATLSANGSVRPAGEARGPEGPLSVSVGSELGSVDDILALPLQGRDGIVTIAQVADVALATLPESTISRVNGNPSLTLTITPGPGANVVNISHAVTAALDELTPSLGEGAEFVTLFDQAPFIEQSVHDLSVEGGLGLLFAVLVILVFLWAVRPTIIAAVSIPLSLLITLIGLRLTDNTLNMLTLGALTIAVGRVVDDSIVVIENIKRHQAGGRLTPESILRSVAQVAGAITASTLTTVAVFLPIIFVSGVAGQLFRPFAITVTIALLASLLVALTIVPVLAYWLLRGKDPLPGEEEPELSPEARAIAEDETKAPVDRLQRAFLPALDATRRHPIITLTASGAMLIVTLFLASMLQIDFLGQSGQQTVRVTQTMPKGTTLEDRSEAAKPLEAAIGGVSGVENTVATLSEATAGTTEPTTDLQVLLREGVDAEAVTAKIQRAVDGLSDVGEVAVAAQDSTGIGGDTINLAVLGDDREALVAAAEALEQELGGARGVASVTNTLKGEQPTLRVVVDRRNAAAIGYDQETVTAAINAALSGSPAGTITLEGTERDIVLSPTAAGSTKEDLEKLLLPVTPQQTQQAQKAVTDRMQAEADAKAEQARIEAEQDLNEQVATVQQGRGEAVTQLGQLREQLAALSEAPLQVPPANATTSAAQARAQAEAERAAQLAQLTEGIAAAEGSITQIDEQLDALAESRRQAEEGLAEQQRLEQERKDLETLSGEPVPVSAVATVTEELSPAEIERSDGSRVVTVKVTPKSGQLEAASAAVDRAMTKVSLPAGVQFSVSGVSADQEDSFAQLGIAMLAAIVLVLLIMIATFRSFSQPLILLVSIPFAATGAVLALLITNTPLGLPALIGLLMLIGIVVTNAIVLIDLINRLRADGAELDDAVHHGTRLRLRPILMTAAATIFALIPMSLGLTGGGVFISKPLAVVVIGGLISSTLLTIVLVPILYTLFARRAIRRGEKRLARRVRRAERRAGIESDASAAHSVVLETGEHPLAALEREADPGEEGAPRA